MPPIGKTKIASTAAAAWTRITDLDGSGYVLLLDVRFNDTTGETIQLRDGDEDVRYSFTSTGTVYIDQPSLGQPYPLKLPVDYHDSDASGGNELILHYKRVF